MIRAFASLAFVLATLSAGSAFAADVKKPHKVIRLDSITIEGKIQKPQAFLLLQRSNLNFEELERTESFIPKVIKSVDKDPF